MAPTVQRRITARQIVLGGLTAVALAITLTSCSSSATDLSSGSTSAKQVAASPTPVIEVKEESTTAPVPFGQVVASDPNALVGTSAVTTVGVDGVKTTTFKVTYKDGVEVAREMVSDVVTTAAIDQVTTNGTKQPVVVAPKAAASSCDPNYSGQCVPIASDVDCLPGSGDGPAYVRGAVRVVGSDIYDLDRDGDGVGCD
jgi:hypothetical protein